MKKLRTALLAVVALMGTGFAASGQSVGAREQIANATQQSDASFARKDLAGCMKFHTADFLGQSVSGPPYNRQQAKQNVARFIALMHSGHNQTIVESMTPVAGGMRIVVREHTVANILGLRSHKLHVLVFDAQAQDIWVPTKAGWRLRQQTQLSQTATIDGKIKSIKSRKAGPA